MKFTFKATALRHGVDMVDFHIRCNHPVFRSLGDVTDRFTYRLRDSRLCGFIIGCELVRFDGEQAVVELEFETSIFNDKTVKQEVTFPVKFHRWYLMLLEPTAKREPTESTKDVFVLSWMGAYVRPKVDLTGISYNRTLLHSHPVGKSYNAILLS